MAELSFSAFFRQVWGHDPFPWQERLAGLFASGAYPDAIDIPTGAGKSAVVDAHLWALATSPGLRRRLWVIIDRRVLVDQIEDRTNRILGVCRDAPADSPAGQVRQQLTRLVADLPGDDRFAAAFSLRGGGDTDPTAWVARPDLPAVIASTVDQAGSAALHRPYLLSARTAPMGAAAFSDAVVVVDEAQLAVPAIATLTQLEGLWGGDPACSWGRPPKIVATTATHTADTGVTVTLDDHDRNHPVLARRLSTPRWVQAGSGVGTAALIKHAKTLMQDLSGSGMDAPCVAVVCNTVAASVTVARALEGKGSGARVVRITGRQRPADRGEALELLRSVLVGGARDQGPLYVVATQTIECGVDLDADSMVTVAAPWPNVVQRIGRVNRIGRLDSARIVVVKASKELVGPYPTGTVTETYRWLNTQDGPVDLCPAQIGMHDLSSDIDPQPVPGLATTLVDAWASNLPHDACAPVGPYLHGLPVQPDRDVDVVWRHQLHPTDELGWWADLVVAAPPQPPERCPVPIGQAARWLHPDGTERPWVRVRGGQPPEVTTDRPRPGDTIVVTAAYGGADRWGWTGQPDDVPADRAELATFAGMPDEDGWQPITVPEPVAGLTGVHVDEDDGTVLHVVSVKTVSAAFLDLVNTDQCGHTQPVSLEGHQTDTADRAGQIADHLGLGPDERDAAVRAARWHDQGKADTRFQTYLGADAGQTLGKSGGAYGWAEHRRRWAAAGLPAGWRHEAESVTADAFNGWDDDTSPVPVRLGAYLAGVHHGHGRPLWPATPDGPDLQAIFSSAWAELRHELLDRYGPWRLALLETVVRAADWSASAHPERD